MSPDNLDPDPASGDLPAVAQPTLPPPPDEEQTNTTKWPTRLLRPTVIAGAVVVMAIGGYALFASAKSSHSTDADARRHAVVVHPADLALRVQGALGSLSQKQTSVDQPCVHEDTRVPVVIVANSEEQPVVLSAAVALAEINSDDRLATAPRIAVVQTIGLTEPHASVGTQSPGRYEGQLVIVDGSTGALLCHTRILAWSSPIAEQQGIAERVLRDDFDARVLAAFTEAGSRLHVELEL